eukprot:6196968-Pleurochrysis_carterae.AAC.10
MFSSTPSSWPCHRLPRSWLCRPLVPLSSPWRRGLVMARVRARDVCEYRSQGKPSSISRGLPVLNQGKPHLKVFPSKTVHLNSVPFCPGCRLSVRGEYFLSWTAFWLKGKRYRDSIGQEGRFGQSYSGSETGFYRAERSVWANKVLVLLR